MGTGSDAASACCVMKPEKPQPIGWGFFCVYGRRHCLDVRLLLLLAVGGVTIDP